MGRKRMDKDDREFEKQFVEQLPSKPPKKLPTCPTKKICWMKQSSAYGTARNIGKRNNDPFIESYKCRRCGFWHVGHPKGTKPPHAGGGKP